MKLRKEDESPFNLNSTLNWLSPCLKLPSFTEAAKIEAPIHSSLNYLFAAHQHVTLRQLSQVVYSGACMTELLPQSYLS
jgi:hypothetical protein